MTDRYTVIELPGVDGAHMADHGRCTVPEMIELLRRHARFDKAAADAILAASDEDFHIVTQLGLMARSKVEVLQEGRKP